jgi:hypothetical protein
LQKPEQTAVQKALQNAVQKAKLDGKGRPKGQAEVPHQVDVSGWLEAPWNLAPEAAAALADPLTFENLSYVFLRVMPAGPGLCYSWRIHMPLFPQ